MQPGCHVVCRLSAVMKFDIICPRSSMQAHPLQANELQAKLTGCVLSCCCGTPCAGFHTPTFRLYATGRKLRQQWQSWHQCRQRNMPRHRSSLHLCGLPLAAVTQQCSWPHPRMVRGGPCSSLPSVSSGCRRSCVAVWDRGKIGNI